MTRSLDAIRSDFPALAWPIRGKPLIYLDNAATTQVPRPVLDRVTAHYLEGHANVYRGSYALSQQASAQVEQARETLARFLGAPCPESIVFTSGATASINLAAQSFLERQLGPGQAVVVTGMEHHSNFLPWQRLCRLTGAQLREAPVTGDGTLDLEALGTMLDETVRLVAVCAVSNVLGTVNPVETITAMAHRVGAAVLVDGAQAIRHQRWNLEQSEIDFFCCSGHKMMAPTGTGILYVRPERWNQMEPTILGGGMVERVFPEYVTFAPMPHRLEAGTPNIGGILALARAADYLEELGLEELFRYERALTTQLERILSELPRVHVLGRPEARIGVVSVTAEDATAADLAAMMDKYGVALRAGSQCAQPLLRSMGLSGVLRFSTAFYNTEAELEQAGQAMAHCLTRLRRWAK